MHGRGTKGQIIRDRTIGAQGFNRFASSAVAEKGQEIVFAYPSGARYRVPLEYLLCWYSESHDQDKSKAEWPLRILRSRKIADGRMVRIYLSDGKQYDVPWDTVLMACEPRYEYFGGLTPQSKELAKRWVEERGSFGIIRRSSSGDDLLTKRG